MRDIFLRHHSRIFFRRLFQSGAVRRQGKIEVILVARQGKQFVPAQLAQTSAAFAAFVLEEDEVMRIDRQHGFDRYRLAVNDVALPFADIFCASGELGEVAQGAQVFQAAADGALRGVEDAGDLPLVGGDVAAPLLHRLAEHPQADFFGIQRVQHVHIKRYSRPQHTDRHRGCLPPVAGGNKHRVVFIVHPHLLPLSGGTGRCF